MKKQHWLYLLSIGALLFYLSFWVYRFYPNVGHDLSYGVVSLFEMKLAFQKYGVFDFEFSPVRCLGLPVFSNPNGLIWSLFHIAGVFLDGTHAFTAIAFFILLFSFIGTIQFCRLLGLRTSLALLFALGWCLQGWNMSHLMAGHHPYTQFSLWPFFFWVLARPQKYQWRFWPFLGAAAFWTAHLFFTGGYYLFLAGFPGLILTFFFLKYLNASSVTPSHGHLFSIAQARIFFFRLFLVIVLGLGAASAKILATLDFSSNYPRVMDLVQVEGWRILAYVTMTLGLTLPIEYNRITDWFFRSWESNLFVLPNFILILIFYWIKRYISFSYKPYLKSLAVLVILGVVLGSGWLKPLFSVLPVFKSLYVNPRWFAMVLVPYFGGMVFLFARLDQQKPKHFKSLLVICWSLVLFTPLTFSWQQEQSVLYQGYIPYYVEGRGIDLNSERVNFCYEPIFGYGLELFPYAPHQMDWVHGPRLDPRCYLKSGNCRPGSLLTGDLNKSKELEALQNFTLETTHMGVARLKPLAMSLYVLSFLMAWLAFFKLIWMEWKSVRYS